MKKIYALLITLGLMAFYVAPTPVIFAADVLSPVCNDGLRDPETGLPPAACQSNADQPRSGNSIYGPDGVLTRVAGLFARAVGTAAVIMIIIGGFKYITSSGDSANVQSAKNTILFAIVGLIIVAMAQVITGFVLDKAT